MPVDCVLPFNVTKCLLQQCDVQAAVAAAAAAAAVVNSPIVTWQKVNTAALEREKNAVDTEADVEPVRQWWGPYHEKDRQKRAWYKKVRVVVPMVVHGGACCLCCCVFSGGVRVVVLLCCGSWEAN